MERREVGLRTRWAAIGAALAVVIGSGGLRVADATIDSGERPVYVSVPGDRIVDTRNAIGLTGRFADGVPRDVQVTGSVPVAPSGSKVVVPTGATGVVVTATVVGTTEAGFLSVRPKGATGVPETSNVNFGAGETIANSVTVDLPADGGIQIWYDSFAPGGTADVLIDVVAFLDDHTHDDRYYTEAESNARYAPRTVTETLGVMGFRSFSAGQSVLRVNGCVSNSTSNSAIVLPIDLPIGAVLERVVVDVLATNAGFGPYATELQRYDQTGGVTTTKNVIANASGGGTPGPARIFTHVLTPGTAEVVESDETFELFHDIGTQTANGVCAVEVTYTLPGA